MVASWFEMGKMYCAWFALAVICISVLLIKGRQRAAVCEFWLFTLLGSAPLMQPHYSETQLPLPGCATQISLPWKLSLLHYHLTWYVSMETCDVSLTVHAHTYCCQQCNAIMYFVISVGSKKLWLTHPVCPWRSCAFSFHAALCSQRE